MVSNLAFRARIAAGLALSVTLAGCSLLHGSRQPAAAPADDTAPPAAQAAAPAGDSTQTATEAAIASADAPPAQAQAAAAPAPQMNPNAPLTYTVKRGDTLWGIASMYLRDPWNWPEVWYINPHIRNPHLIYPGDKLALAYDADGRPQVRLVEASALRLEPRLRSTPISAAIPTIPYSAIAAFLARPTVLSADEVRDAAHIIAFKNDHVIAGSGHVVYIRGLEQADHSRYAIVHVDEGVRDPDTGHVLGYVGIYTATALVSQPVTNPVRAVLIDTARETLVGDKVMSSDTQPPLNLVPHAPATQVNGKIAWIVGDTGISDLAGQYDIVVLNRGSDAGLEPGSVLEVDQAGEEVRDTYGTHGGALRGLGAMGSELAPKVKLPDERAGTLIVFKAYPQLSFGLIVGASDTIAVGDIIHNP